MLAYQVIGPDQIIESVAFGRLHLADEFPLVGGLMSYYGEVFEAAALGGAMISGIALALMQAVSESPK